MTRQVILASGSPRRIELLTRMGVPFTAVTSNFDEYLDHGRPTAEVAMELGLGKARAVAEQHPAALVIGGDTIVTLDGKQLAKPADIKEARRTLRAHAGKTVQVVSSAVLVCKELGLEIAEADEAFVTFKPYNEAENEKYLATGDWADKAGGWGTQSGAAPLISHLEGRYDTIMGMPTHIVARLLREQGIAARESTLEPPAELKRKPKK
jgi:septum formation protein